MLDTGEGLLFFDPLKCVDCKICELACSFLNRGGFNPRSSLIRIFINSETGVNTLSLSKDCTLCRACEENCPTGALRFFKELSGPIENASAAMVVKKGFTF